MRMLPNKFLKYVRSLFFFRFGKDLVSAEISVIYRLFRTARKVSSENEIAPDKGFCSICDNMFLFNKQI